MKILKMNPFSRQGHQDDGLRKKLDGYSVAPPEHIWGNIEANLDKEKSRRGILFFILPLALLLTVGGAYWYASQGHSHAMVAVSHTGNVQATHYANASAGIASNSSTPDKIPAPVTTVGNASSALPSGNNLLTANSKLPEKAISHHMAVRGSGWASINANYVQNKTSKLSANKNTSGNKTNTTTNVIENNTTNEVSSTSAVALTPDADIAFSKPKAISIDKDKVALSEPTAEDTKAAEKKPDTKPIISPVDKGKRKSSFDPSGWVWGIEAGPGFAGRMLNNSSGATEPGTNIDPVTYFNGFETQKFSMQEGVVFRQYSASPHWAWQTGVYIINDGFIDNGTVSANDKFVPTSAGNYTFTRNNSTGDYVVTLDKTNKDALSKPGTQFRIKNNYWWLNVPLEGQYRFTLHHICYFVQGGGSLKFLMAKYGNLQYMYTNKPTGWDQVTEEGTYKSFGFGAQLRAGVMLPIADDRLTLEISPGMDMNISSMTNGTAYGIYPYSFHMNVGIFKKF